MAEAAKSFGQSLNQVGQLLGGLNTRQRVYLVGGAVLVGLTLWAFVVLLGKPKMVTVYSGLKPEEAQTLGSRLAAKNIPYELSSDGGSLLVPSDKLDQSRLETASQGLPRNARLGFELFDNPNWTGTDFSEKVNYQRALEGELERTLQTLNEVQAVRVHLVMPRESLFIEQEHPAKASVIIKTRGGRLSEQAQLAIPQLVASAVEELRPENVTVVDADSNTPLLRTRGPGNSLSYTLDDELSKTLLRTLEPVVGADHVRASVHVEYDLSTSENTEEIYDPKTTATLTSQRSEENMGGASPAGVPGTTSNLPGKAVAAVTLNSDTQSSRSESASYAVSKSIRHVSQPPGRIKRVAAAVLVDDAVEFVDNNGTRTLNRRKRTTDEMKEIERLAGAAIGIDTQRGDMLAVQNLSFQEMPVEVPPPPTKVERTRRLLLDWSGLLRYIGLGALFLIVYFLMLRPVKKQVLTAFRELPMKVGGARAELSPAAAGVAAQIAGGSVQIELPAASEGAHRARALKEEVARKIKSEPAAASRLVQTWIRGEGEK